MWAHFIPKPSWIEWLDWPEVAPGILLLHLHKHEQQTRIAKRFRDMLQLNAGAYRLREALAMNALEEILLWCDLANPIVRPLDSTDEFAMGWILSANISLKP